MTPPLQNRTHRKVVYATDADLERLALLRTLVEHDALFSRHPVHEAELFRAALAMASYGFRIYLVIYEHGKALLSYRVQAWSG